MTIPAVDLLSQQQRLCRQRMMQPRTDFGQRKRTALKTNRMTIGRNRRLQFITITLRRPPCTDIEQLWVHRLGIQMKAQIGDFWANR